MAFGLCPMLTQAAAELLLHHGDAADAGRLSAETGIRRMDRNDATDRIAGRLGSGARSHQGEAGRRALRISGQKIFITYGEHDLAPNIIHAVLARTPNAPEGVKACRFSWCPSSWCGKTAISGRATIFAACRSSTNWASTRAPRR